MTEEFEGGVRNSDYDGDRHGVRNRDKESDRNGDRTTKEESKRDDFRCGIVTLLYHSWNSFNNNKNNNNNNNNIISNNSAKDSDYAHARAL